MSTEEETEEEAEDHLPQGAGQLRQRYQTSEELSLSMAHLTTSPACFIACHKYHCIKPMYVVYEDQVMSIQLISELCQLSINGAKSSVMKRFAYDIHKLLEKQ